MPTRHYAYLQGCPRRSRELLPSVPRRLDGAGLTALRNGQDYFRSSVPGILANP